MDSPGLDGASHARALRGLARINRLSLAAERTWAALRGYVPESGRALRILDVACGGGDVAIALKRRADRMGLPVEVAGCDVSREALGFARKRAAEQNLEVTFFQHDVRAGNLPSGFDFVCSSLFLHHLSNDDAVAVLGKMASSGGRVFVQDLLRTRLGYLLALAAGQVLTRSPVVRTDGPLSVRAAFDLPEVREVARRAGLEGASIRRCWPERFSLLWRAG